MVTLTWHARKHQVHKHHRYILFHSFYVRLGTLEIVDTCSSSSTKCSLSKCFVVIVIYDLSESNILHSPITTLLSQTHLSCWMVLHRYLSTLMTHKASISLFSIMQFSWVASMTSAMWNPFTESVTSGYWVNPATKSVKSSYRVREMQLLSLWNPATKLVKSSYWVGEIQLLSQWNPQTPSTSLRHPSVNHCCI